MMITILNIVRSPRYIVNSPFLNSLGIQKLRIKRKLMELKKPEICALDEKSKSHLEELEKNGIVIIKDFLPEEDFQSLLGTINSIREKKLLRSEVGKEGGAVQWEHGYLQAGVSEVVDKKFRENEFLMKIISNYTRRKFMSLPEVIYQKLFILEKDTDKEDVQTVLHMDRYYRTIKVFYTVSDHTANNGAFWYSPGSQKMSPRRIEFEKEFSLRAAIEKSGHREKIDPNLLQFGRSVIHPDFKNDFKEVQMCAPKNSLMIVDVSGFHKRGLISPGHSRETIRLIYHYLHAPYMFQWLFKKLKKSPGRYLN